VLHYSRPKGLPGTNTLAYLAHLKRTKNKVLWIRPVLPLSLSFSLSNKKKLFWKFFQSVLNGSLSFDQNPFGLKPFGQLNVWLTNQSSLWQSLLFMGRPNVCRINGSWLKGVEPIKALEFLDSCNCHITTFWWNFEA
jgi:hypothetical protein